MNNLNKNQKSITHQLNLFEILPIRWKLLFNYLCSNNLDSFYNFKWLHDKICGYFDLIGYFVKKHIPSAKTLQRSHLHHHWLIVWKLAQVLHTFEKRSPSTYKFSDFLMLAWKFTKFLVLFFKPKVSFSSKLASLLSLMRDIS